MWTADELLAACSLELSFVHAPRFLPSPQAVAVGSEVLLWDEGLVLAEAQERTVWHEGISR